jgi:hypothetical protein
MAASDPPRADKGRRTACVLGVGVNQHTFSSGQVLTTSVGLSNLGFLGLADLYWGMLTTDSDDIRPSATSVPGCSSSGMNRKH